MITLKNRTGRASQIGYLAKAVGYDGFGYAGVGDTPIGVIIESVKKDEYCQIQTTGQVKVYVAKHTLANKLLRVPVAGDGAPAGSAVPIGSEEEYISVGRTLESGKGLISIAIDLSETTIVTEGLIPAGGAQDTILTKLSAADYDVGWVAAGSAVTSVTGGYGIVSTGGSTPDISLDGSELDIDDGTSFGGTSYFMFVAGAVTELRRTTEVPISTFVNDSGYTANLGTVTAVTASSPLASSGGTTPNISFDSASISTMASALLAEDYILVTDTSDSGLMKKKLISLVPLGEFNNNEGWASGTVTSVLGGTGIDSDGSPTTPSLSFDGSELPVGSVGLSSADHIVIVNGTVSERWAMSTLPLSYFNNDQGWTNSSGTVTLVSGGIGITVINGSTTPTVTLALDELSERTGTVATDDRIAGVTAAGDDFAETISNIPLSRFNNDVAFWSSDANGITYSAGNVGIGAASSASYKLDVNGAGRFVGHIYQGDNYMHYFGSDNDASIWHDGTNFIFRSNLADGKIYLQGKDSGGTNRTMIYINPSGGLALNYNGTTKLNTSSGGVAVTGALTATGEITAWL